MYVEILYSTLSHLGGEHVLMVQFLQRVLTLGEQCLKLLHSLSQPAHQRARSIRIYIVILRTCYIIYMYVRSGYSIPTCILKTFAYNGQNLAHLDSQLKGL